jgi:hypothetical protein
MIARPRGGMNSLCTGNAAAVAGSPGSCGVGRGCIKSSLRLVAGQVVMERRRMEAQLRLHHESPGRLARLGSIGQRCGRDRRKERAGWGLPSGRICVVQRGIRPQSIGLKPVVRDELPG